MFQLIKVVGYDLRKIIRAQIRLVKKLISENTLETYITTRMINLQNSKQSVNRKVSETKDNVDARQDIKKNTEYRRKTPERTETTERKQSYTERRTSSDYTTTSTITRRSKTPEKITTVNKTVPESTSKIETKETFTKLKKTVPGTLKKVDDDKPEWVKQRNLKKTSELNISVGKKITTCKTTSTATTATSTKTATVRKSPAKDIKSTDLITSSYGVGPTDENGTPLFGLRALRAQNATTKGNSSYI